MLGFLRISNVGTFKAAVRLLVPQQRGKPLFRTVFLCRRHIESRKKRLRDLIKLAVENRLQKRYHALPKTREGNKAVLVGWLAGYLSYGYRWSGLSYCCKTLIELLAVTPLLTFVFSVSFLPLSVFYIDFDLLEHNKTKAAL